MRKHRLHNVPVFWGVVFPHFEFNQSDPEWEQYQICDSRKIGNIGQYLQELTINYKDKLRRKGLNFSSHEITAHELKNIKNVLRRDIHISWEQGNKIERSNEELLVLEENQETVLDEFLYSDVPRMVLRGCAGTGKTLLAKKAAKILADRGLSILFLVFNRLLKEELSKQFKGHKVEVLTILEFMSRSIKQFSKDELTTNDIELFSLSFYDAVVNNETIADEHKFDFLVCDEAQDFMSEEISRGLFEFIRGNAQNGNWLLCLDDIVQSEIYGIYSRNFIKKLEKETRSHSRELYRNYRNPKQIADLANGLYPDENMAIAARKFDSFPKIITTSSKSDEWEKLGNLIKKLTNSGVSPRSINVLTFTAKQNSSLNLHSEIVGFSFGNLQDRNEYLIEWSQVSAFKGLENDIIIIAELPANVLDVRKAELFVAMTRAKTELYVLCEKNDKFVEVVTNA